MDMRSKNAVLEKSFNLALDVVRFCKNLAENKKEYVLSKQLIKAGTSIGANIQEAQSAESKQDFIHKLSISLKEARETKYWLLLITKGSYATAEDTNDLLHTTEEVTSLLVSIIKSAKKQKAYNA